MRHQTIAYVLLTLVLLAVAGACVRPAPRTPTAIPAAGETATPLPPLTRPSPTPTATPTVTSSPPTGPTATQTTVSTETPTPAPTETHTPVPTATLTATPEATATPTVVAERVSFDPDATSAVVSGDLVAGGVDHYVVRAKAGQVMEVDVTAPQAVRLAIYGADGTVIADRGEGTPTFRGLLPLNQDYVVALEASAQPTSYEMTVVVPEQIAFAPGATWASMAGDLAPDARHHYVLSVVAGQLLDASAFPVSGLRLILYGVDGTVLKSGMSVGSSFRGTVPASQDYVLVLAAGRDGAVTYTMAVMVPERISFAPGATQAQVEGELPAHGKHDYVIGAQADQVLEIDVTSREPTQLVIFGVDGTVLMSGMGGGAFFRGLVPGTQDYVVSLVTGAEAASYRMGVQIPVRIQFAPGETSATDRGELKPYQQRSYVVRALEGQQMEVTVTAPTERVSLIVYGLDGTALKSSMGEGTTFEGTLPSSQDYIAAITAGDAAVSYTLEVRVQ